MFIVLDFLINGRNQIEQMIALWTKIPSGSILKFIIQQLRINLLLIHLQVVYIFFYFKFFHQILNIW